MNSPVLDSGAERSGLSGFLGNPMRQRTMTPVGYSVGSVPSGSVGMRFVLNYDGSLPSNGGKKDKHRIRKTFHPQLKRQWEVDTCLQAMTHGASVIPGYEGPRPTRIDQGGFEFIPLVTKNLHLVCSLDITFLRPEEPGDLIRPGGDIDNRLKTLLDSLTVPNKDQIKSLAPDEGETPFYCLLEDDSLITGIQVRTERLLLPTGTPSSSDVRLMIAVVVHPTRVTLDTLNFPGWF